MTWAAVILALATSVVTAMVELALLPPNSSSLGGWEGGLREGIGRVG